MNIWKAIFWGVVTVLCTWWCWYEYIGKTNKTNDNYKRLIGACFGDKSKAERLIHLELKGGKALGRNAAVNLALERLERDRSQS